MAPGIQIQQTKQQFNIPLTNHIYLNMCVCFAGVICSVNESWVVKMSYSLNIRRKG